MLLFALFLLSVHHTRLGVRLMMDLANFSLTALTKIFHECCLIDINQVGRVVTDLGLLELVS